jgi:hypothetical protein
MQTSFGFGQVGGSALVVHPRHLFAALEPIQYATYKTLNRSRALLSYKSMTEMMTSNTLVKVKDHPPYTPDLETPVLLNPLARTQLDKTGSYSFPKKLPTARVLDEANVKAVSNLLESQNGTTGVGVDQGKLGPFAPLPYLTKDYQSSYPLSLLLTRPLFNGTSRKAKSIIVTHNPLRQPRLPLAGPVKKPYSRLWGFRRRARERQ